MGLDVLLYRNVCAAPDVSRENYEAHEADDTLLWLYAHPDFPKQADGLTPGPYRADGREHVYRWSYGGYNRWREELSRGALGVEPEVVWKAPVCFTHPLEPLIRFSDCDGTFGPTTAGMVAGGLAEVDPAIFADEYARAGLLALRDAFAQAAATNGVVVWR